MPTNRNIIIIEDNETFSLLITHYLRNNLGDVNVFIENSGKNAIHTINKLNPALVVLDYYLEDDISAKDVMEVINKMPLRPKVILLSSMTDEKEKSEIMAMGIERFIPKSNESIYDLVKEIQDQMHLIDPAAQSRPRVEKSGLSTGSIIGVVAAAFLIVLILYIFLG
jgi:DNA-binding NarL/FixJ family response regulator